MTADDQYVPDEMDARGCFLDGAAGAFTREDWEAFLTHVRRDAKAEAWREYAAALEAVPDYAPTAYDKGRVDQRHATVEELHARATRGDEETR